MSGIVPMTAAALPPRVTRPSTAPSNKPRVLATTHVAAVPTATAVATQQHQHEAAATATNYPPAAHAAAGSGANARPRPSSAVVVRPIGSSVAAAYANGAVPAAAARPLSGASSRPASAIVHHQQQHQQQQSRPTSAGYYGYHGNATAAQQAAANMTSRTAAVASVKGDILLLQRTIDKLTAAASPSSSANAGQQQQQQFDAFSADAASSLTHAAARDGLFEMEQILAHEFPPLLPGDESAAADMHAKLLELFVQRLNAGALQALRQLVPPSLREEECERVSLVSRTSAITALLNRLLLLLTGPGGVNNVNIGTARRAGGAAATAASSSQPQTQTAQTQTHSVGGLSAAELTDFQALLKEQRDIQTQMRKTLSSPSSAAAAGGNDPTTGNAAASSSSMIRSDRAQLRKLREELDEAGRTIAALNLELGTMRAQLNKSESARQQAQQQVKDHQQQQQQQHHQKQLSGEGAGDEGRSRKNSRGANAAAAAADDANNTGRSQELDGSASGNSGSNAALSSSAVAAALGPAAILQNASPDVAMAVAMAAAVGFHRVDPEVLLQVGLDSALADGPRLIPERYYAEQLASRVGAVVAEVQQQIKDDEAAAGKGGGASAAPASFAKSTRAGGGGGGAGGGKRDKPDSPEALAAKIGAMWWVLERQNGTVQAMQLLLAKQHDQLRTGEADMAALDKRTRRVIAVLEDKLGHAKSMVQRLVEENEALQQAAAAAGAGSRSQSRTPSGEATPTGEQLLAGNRRAAAGGAAAGAAAASNLWGPNVRTSNDDPTPEEIRKAHERTELRLERRLLELEQDNAEKGNAVEQARVSAAASHREIQALKARVAALEKELKASRAAEQGAVAEARSLREERDANRKDLRETKIAGTEAQQKAARLEVELHISQNIVEDLRSRELQLERQSGDSKQCHDILKGKMRAEREAHAREVARIREEHRASKHEVIVANQILADERAKALANEREIERLRGLDLQLETLQQNFANYAGAKQAQKEAHEEEERALQACVELVGQDVFALPFGDDDNESGEAEVELLLQRLRDAEEGMAQEERTRETLRSTVVGFRDERSGRKQLATLMQRRYNAIQIFACQQRLRQLQLERRLQDALVQNDEHRVQYEGAMVELSHARSHEQALLQRNSELEQQRREGVKGREAAEAEVRSLKQTVQRMRIANEEQEAAIVDLGTKLKKKELASRGGGSSGGDDPAASLNGTRTTLGRSM